MDSVMCAGNESSLLDCGHSGWGINKCSHDEDAGVICSTGGKEYLIMVASLFVVNFLPNNRNADDMLSLKNV